MQRQFDPYTLRIITKLPLMLYLRQIFCIKLSLLKKWMLYLPYF